MHTYKSSLQYVHPCQKHNKNHVNLCAKDEDKVGGRSPPLAPWVVDAWAPEV